MNFISLIVGLSKYLANFYIISICSESLSSEVENINLSVFINKDIFYSLISLINNFPKTSSSISTKYTPPIPICTLFPKYPVPVCFATL
ncbi:hypothetical protein FLJU110815_19710 [Flavobacterium jumunjinense]